MGEDGCFYHRRSRRCDWLPHREKKLIRLILKGNPSSSSSGLVYVSEVEHELKATTRGQGSLSLPYVLFCLSFSNPVFFKTVLKPLMLFDVMPGDNVLCLLVMTNVGI